MERHDFLSALHDAVRPRTYLEIGVNYGQSLSLSRVPTVAVDPEFSITEELQADVHVARTTSDEFFARANPLAHLPEPLVDLAFIDGMHLAEFTLRDVLAVERFTHPTSVIVLDDVLPRSVTEANRTRTTAGWTGDVYKVPIALRELCAPMVVLEVDTEPTGVAVVLCPDATRDGVLPGYDDWLEAAVVPDPQPVPDDVLARTHAVDPERLLASDVWDVVRGHRGSSPRKAAAALQSVARSLSTV